MTTQNITRPISGHTDPETAYLVEDYPYGFRLRTSIRYWVETKKGHGQRFVSQTINPKTSRWNKPKADTYSSLTVLALDDQGHVINEGLSEYSSSETLELFALWAVGHLTEWQLGALDYLRAIRRASERITYTIHTCQTGCTENHQTQKDQNRMVNSLVRHEMRKGTAA